MDKLQRPCFSVYHQKSTKPCPVVIQGLKPSSLNRLISADNFVANSHLYLEEVCLWRSGKHFEYWDIWPLVRNIGRKVEGWTLGWWEMREDVREKMRSCKLRFWELCKFGIASHLVKSIYWNPLYLNGGWCLKDQGWLPHYHSQELISGMLCLEGFWVWNFEPMCCKQPSAIK